jgi:hypothetical protein
MKGLSQSKTKPGAFQIVFLFSIHIESIFQQVYYSFPLSSVTMDLEVVDQFTGNSNPSQLSSMDKSLPDSKQDQAVAFQIVSNTHRKHNSIYVLQYGDLWLGLASKLAFHPVTKEILTDISTSPKYRHLYVRSD